MSVFEFIEKHKFSIIGTLALHIGIFIYLNIQNVEYSIYVGRERIIATMDFTEDESLEQENPESQNDPSNPTGQNTAQNIENLVSNENADPNQNPNINQSAMDQQVWDELRALEADEYNKIRDGKDPVQRLEHGDLNPNDAGQETATSEEPSDAKIAGATAASYSVKNRKALYSPKPSYKCIASGIVKLNIKVSQKGKVTDISIDESGTTTQDECLRSNALTYAKKWRFNQNFEDDMRKPGWIQFTYQAQ